MLIVALIQSQKLPALREAFDRIDTPLHEVNEFMLGGNWVARIVFQCDELPPPEFEVPIEAVIHEQNYCFVCQKKLLSNNRSGFCSDHYDRSPSRIAEKKIRRSQRKRKKTGND